MRTSSLENPIGVYIQQAAVLVDMTLRELW